VDVATARPWLLDAERICHYWSNYCL
jgi:hypothetical protein